MNHFVPVLALLAVWICPQPVRAQVPLGTEVAVLPYAAAKAVADPIRPRVYLADVNSSSIQAIDTTTLKLVASIPTGPNPVDLVIAADGSVLYVANRGSNLQAVSVVDLASLTVARTLSLPGYPKAITLNQGSDVYVAASLDLLSVQSSIYEIDGQTGGIQRRFNTSDTDNDFLQFGPDGIFLFVASKGNFDEDDDSYSGTFEQFDTSTTGPTLIADNDSANQLAVQLVLSPTGKFLALAGNAGNSAFVADETILFPPADITNNFQTYSNAGAPGPLAFSPDDSRLYQTLVQDDPSGATNRLQVFDTSSRARLSEITFPALIASTIYPNTITTIVADNTGSYLFIGESVFLANGSNGIDATAGQTVVVATGEGTLSPPSSPEPTVTLTATIPSVTEGSGVVGEFTLTLAAVQEHDVTVNLTIKGNAINGSDYSLLKATKKIKAGKMSKPIKIFPQGDLDGAASKTVKLELAAGDGYMVGTAGKVKVKILSGE